MIKVICTMLFVSLSALADDDSWINQQNRMFVDDRIQYWGTGADQVEEMALFKAKGMAIKSIGEECGGFFSKDIVIRRQKVEMHNGEYRAYVHADIPYVSCNYSKTPMAKKNPDLEGNSIVQNQKLYDSLLKDQFSNKAHKESDVLRKEILSHIKNTKDESDKKISILESRVKNLESRPAQQHIQQTIIQNNYQLTPSESAYQDCMEKYWDYMDDASRNSDKNGNLVSENALPYYNKAIQQKIRCDGKLKK